MFGVYLNENHELVIEIAVPGRGGEDLDVRVNDNGAVQITMPPKVNTPGSLLALSINAPLEGVDTNWNVQRMRATCQNGLLTMAFPMKSEVAAQTKAESQRRPVPNIDPKSIFKNRIRELG